MRVGSEIFGARQYKATGDGTKSTDAPADAGHSPAADGGPSSERSTPSGSCPESGDAADSQTARLAAAQ